MSQNILAFIDNLQKSFSENSFIKLTLAEYIGAEKELKNIYIKAILIKNEKKYSFTYRYKTKDIVKNYLEDETISLISNYLFEFEFKTAILFDLSADINLQLKNNGQYAFTKLKPSKKASPTSAHDKQKSRKIDSKSIFLQKLKITDNEGIVFKNAQDKFKQINHYIELLSPLIKDLPKTKTLKVVDMGSGKGYLTFALYDYLNNSQGIEAEVVGVEFRQDMVELCNKIAEESGFKKLRFEKGTILDFKSEAIDILIALHACDTATDDAIFKGINANASLIVVAPCCHKQVRKEMEKTKAKNELDFLTKHGIFLERQAEMATDGLRALFLEYSGYSTTIQQFISDAHTPKNVMITAVKKENLKLMADKIKREKLEISEKIQNIKKYFGISKHHLEGLLISIDS